MDYRLSERSVPERWGWVTETTLGFKLWDINMDAGPVTTFQVHEHLRPKLCNLYENDSIFDKFECCLSGDGMRVATGSYSNLFCVFGCAPGSTEASTLEASKNPMRFIGNLDLCGRAASA